MGKSNLNREDLKCYINELVEGKVQEIKNDKEENRFEEIDELSEFMSLVDVVDIDTFPQVVINEEEIEYTEEEEEVQHVNINCVVNDEVKILADKVNCNIKQIPILGINLISPINLEIQYIGIGSDMESINELEVTLHLKRDDGRLVLYKLDLESLLRAGLVSIIDNLNDSIRLSALEFRGLIEKVNIDEINDIILKGVF